MGIIGRDFSAILLLVLQIAFVRAAATQDDIVCCYIAAGFADCISPCCSHTGWHCLLLFCCWFCRLHFSVLQPHRMTLFVAILLLVLQIAFLRAAATQDDIVCCYIAAGYADCISPCCSHTGWHCLLLFCCWFCRLHFSVLQPHRMTLFVAILLLVLQIAFLRAAATQDDIVCCYIAAGFADCISPCCSHTGWHCLLLYCCWFCRLHFSVLQPHRMTLLVAILLLVLQIAFLRAAATQDDIVCCYIAAGFADCISPCCSHTGWHCLLLFCCWFCSSDKRAANLGSNLRPCET